MSEIDINNLIASTKLKYNKEDIVINIYKPTIAFIDSSEYACRIEIVGGDISYRADIIGLDSMQAIILGIRSIGSHLYQNNLIDQSLIEWEGGDMNFPIFEKT